MATPRDAKSTIAGLYGIRNDVDNIIQSDNAINHWQFDKEIYKDVYQRSQVIKDSVKKGEQILNPYPDLAEDVFYSLYKHRPTLRDEEEVTASHLFNHKLVDEMMQSDDYNRLRQNTRFDMVASALGSEIIHDQLYQNIEQARNAYLERKRLAEEAGQAFNEPDLFEQINDLNAKEKGLQKLQSQLNQGQPQQGGSGGGFNQGGGPKGKKSNMSAAQKKKLQDAINAQLAEVKKAQQQVNQTVAQHGNPMQNIMNNAVKAANTQVGEVVEFMGQWGLTGGDPNIRISYEDKKDALKRIRASDKLKKFAQLIGRFKKLAIQEQKRKVPDGKAIIKDVTVGNDLDKILPSELMLLGHPTAKRLFKMKYTEKQLLQYEKDAMENVGKGPIIVLIDVSGSMGGERELWSKALALALLEVAQKQKRNFACCHFTGHLEETWEIPAGSLKPQDIFDIAEKFAGGGTFFDPPIEWSMKIIQQDRFKKADIVLVTDGDAGLSDEVIEKFNALKKEKQFKLRSVLIDVGGDAATHSVGQISDQVMSISDMANLNDSAASKIFASV